MYPTNTRNTIGLALLVIGSVIFAGNHVLAEIKTDTTLGSEASILNQGVSVKGAIGDIIDGGAVRGTKLFHSFQEFSIGEGQRVYFSNPAGIKNILTRVTGNNRSDILGTLGVLGNANLFLINPNGIVFGQNARLDIAGSFVASTVDSLTLGNGFVYSATKPEIPPLLNINLQPGLQLGTEIGTITNRGNLAVGQNLILSANNLDLQGSLQAGQDLTLNARNQIQMRDTIASPLIAAAKEKLLIQGNQSVNIFALNHPDSGLFSGGDMILRSLSDIDGDAHYWSRGNFRIEKLDGNLGGLFSPDDPIIRSNGDVSLASFTGASLHILAGGKVEIPGNVIIFRPDNLSSAIAETVTLSDGNTVNISGSTDSTLDIRAGINWQNLPGNSSLGQLSSLPSFNNATSADINLGNIRVFDFVGGQGGKIFLTNQYQANPTLSGNIRVNIIDARDSFQGTSLFMNSRGNIAVNIADTSSFRQGNGGDITMIAQGNISPQLLLSRGWLGGNITLKSNANISVATGFISSQSRANTETGSPLTGGDIEITADSLFLTNGANITVINENISNGGNLKITANNIFLEGVPSNGSAGGITSQVWPGSIGKGGDIQITTGKLSAEKGSQVIAITFGAGKAGNVTIHASDRIFLSGISNTGIPGGVASRSQDSGAGGNVNITTRSLTIENSARVSTATTGRGTSGNVMINASDAIVLDGYDTAIISQAFPDTTAGGNINVTTGKLSLFNGAAISSGTRGIGNAGNIQIIADMFIADGVSPITGFASGITAATDDNAQGNGGNIDIISRIIALTNGGQITTSTDARGNAGNIKITTNAINIDGSSPLRENFPSGILSLVRANAQGTGGNIDINTGQMTLTNGGFLDASTFGQGNAGDIKIIANDAMILNSGNNSNVSGDISSQVLSGAVGDGGDIEIFAHKLLLSNGFQIKAQTFGQGNAGNIKINTIDSVVLNGSSPRTNSTGIFTSVGNGGFGTGGNIDIQTGKLTLDNRSIISAETVSNTGGDIRLQLNDRLLLRRNSRISTTAGTAHIIINTPFLLTAPLENNDITANAFSGSGGKIDITTQGILGFTPRTRADLEASLGTKDPSQLNPRSLPTSDITAISQANASLDGQVTIDTPDVDPGSGLVALPTNVVDASRLIAQTCRSGGETTASQQSEFVITGRGGLPPKPSDPLSSDAIWKDLQPYALPDEKAGEQEEKSQGGFPSGRTSLRDATRMGAREQGEKSPTPIVEAQGWVTSTDGKITLVAQAPTTTPHNSSFTPVSCS